MKFLYKILDEIHEKFIINLLLIIIFTGINYFILNIHEKQNLSLHDIVYFTIITHFTIGYGDISPKTLTGKTITCLHVILTWFINLVPIRN